MDSQPVVAMHRMLSSFGLVTVLLLAGCASQNSSSESPSLQEPSEVDASATTGGIRGIVVDSAIRPIAKAIVSIAGPDRKNVTSDENGGFSVGGLKPGTYLLKAKHPFFDEAQTTTEVVAGVKDPPVTKIQLNQVIFGKPYLLTQKFKGFIECSLDLAGSLFSEECGEGVGVPGVGRVGGFETNQVQTDFFVSSNNPQSLVIETVWTPTVGAATTGHLRIIVATDFICDPICGGDFFYDSLSENDADGVSGCPASPVLQRSDEAIQELNLTTETRISHFVWACGEGGTVPLDLQLGQSYEIYITNSFILPLPADWSFVAGSPDPFKPK